MNCREILYSWQIVSTPLYSSDAEAPFVCSRCFANTDTLLTNRTVGNTDKVGAQLPGGTGKAKMPILSRVFSSNLRSPTGAHL